MEPTLCALGYEVSTTDLDGTLDVDGVTTLNDSLDVDGNAVRSTATLRLTANADIDGKLGC